MSLRALTSTLFQQFFICGGHSPCVPEVHRNDVNYSSEICHGLDILLSCFMIALGMSPFRRTVTATPSLSTTRTRPLMCTVLLLFCLNNTCPTLLNICFFFSLVWSQPLQRPLFILAAGSTQLQLAARFSVFYTSVRNLTSRSSPQELVVGSKRRTTENQYVTPFVSSFFLIPTLRVHSNCSP